MEGLSAGNLSETEREQLMLNLKQQIAVANTQELLVVLLHNIFPRARSLARLSVD